jgi:isopenicillin-N epimerase
MRELFLLDPDIVFFNHGSFGATPRPVFESYQRWQRELERNPVKFIQRTENELIKQARATLGDYIGTNGENLVFVTNATFGVNVVVRSLKLGPGDEVLTTDHEYGAVNNNWNFIAEKQGFKYINHPMPLPVTTQAAFVEEFWKGVTPNTRVISISHITSPTALIFPIQDICKRARAAGIITLIDGAHAPGQIPLNLDEIGADFYVGNLHKWLCAPKGAGFLYARPESQGLLEPLVVSHGWHSTPEHPSTFVDIHQYQGTRDSAAFLAVPDAIAFQKEHNWNQVRADCHAMAAEAQQRIADEFDLEPFSPVNANPQWWSQMLSMPLPSVADPHDFSRVMLEDYKIEIPMGAWRGPMKARISIQAYNTQEEIDLFVDVVTKYAKAHIPAA